jgi:hypothetical protein
MTDIQDRRELFADHMLIEQTQNVSLKLHEPITTGVAIRLDKSWEGPANSGTVVFQYNDQYFMYYRAMPLNKDNPSGVLCLATSEDGIHWTKPNLGLVKHAEITETNIVADESGNPFMAIPWLDTRPGTPENERIKTLASESITGEAHTAYADPKGPKRLVFLASGDGATFHKLAPHPELISHLKNAFDGGNTMFWSEVEQQYVLYYRAWDEGRSVARTTSKDLMQWTEHVPMTYSNTPREQFYTNNTMPYFRAPHIYIAPAARFMQDRSAVTQAQGETIHLHSAQGHHYHNDCSDGVLLTTRSGTTNYDRTFMEAFIRPGLGLGNWVSRTNYPVTGILPSGPNEMALFVSRQYMQDAWHVERLTLRLDGFTSVTAPWAGGELLTKPLTFAGKQLEINYRTSAPGALQVEIQDETNTPIPSFTLDDCPEIIGDEITRVVTWKHGTDLSPLAGQIVRLRFKMKDADLFSFKFGD